MINLANCSFVAHPHTEKILFMNIAQFQITGWQLHINTTNVCKKYFPHKGSNRFTLLANLTVIR